MAISPTSDYEAVLATVSEWPTETRLLLLQDVLKTLMPRSPDSRTQRTTVDKAVGLLKQAGRAPSDQEVRQWLDEHRMEKYG